MAKIPVDECPAGPAMDAAVAKTLGLTVRWRQWIDETQPVYLAGTCAARHDDWAEHEDWRRVLPYSTDIGAAWELVDRTAQDKNLSLRLVGPEHPDETGYLFEDGWAAAFIDSQYVYTNIGQCTTAETAPLAICRAFLKANGIEEIEA